MGKPTKCAVARLFEWRRELLSPLAEQVECADARLRESVAAKPSEHTGARSRTASGHSAAQRRGIGSAMVEPSEHTVVRY